MYDKILRHRQTIEAALASEDHGGRDQPQRGGLSLVFDNVQGSLTIQADQDEDLEKANQLINSILSDDSLEYSLGLSDLTSESLLAKMEQQPVHVLAESRINKLPLGTASSWDAATGKPRARPRYGLNVEEARLMLLSSPLPNEMCLGAMATTITTTSSTAASNMYQRPHTTVTKAISDPYVQYLPCVMTNLDSMNLSDRRKLESEDSSYGSDHENNRVWTNHDDVSRTASETLGVEFTEYVTATQTTTHSTSKIECDHYECLEALLADKSYRNKVEYALRLGYTEQQLQQAVLKLGRKAGEDQILEELIRLQKTTKSEVESICSANSASECSSDLKSPRLGINTINSSDEKLLEASGAGALLPIIIDGSNVAMSHGNKERFSCKGIRICVDWFKNRGHKDITVFVPNWRKEASKPETPITDQYILTELEKEKMMSFTPSRQFNGRRVVCHDDRFILNLASETGGIVVSNDNYRELINDKPKYKEVIGDRILGFLFVNDRFMPPDDPLGRNGPTLDQFLRKKVKPSSQLPQPCPYGKKCTYGNKCKYYHPDRVTNQKSITEKLKEQYAQGISEMRARVHSRDSSPGDPLTRTRSMQPKTIVKTCVSRTKSSAPRLGSMWPQQQQQQQQWPGFDPRMPPPPPRGPWSEPTIHQDLQAKTHKKVSRQFSVNPTYDMRIQCLPHQQQDFSKPPPPIVPPPGPTQLHLTVTRNASAPEQPGSGPSGSGSGYPMPTSSSLYSSAGHTPIDLHKTMSWSSDMSGAVSPLIPSSGNVWDSATTSNAYSTNSKEAREKVYYHLANLFDEDKVRRAMKSLPDETNADIICKKMFQMFPDSQ